MKEQISLEGLIESLIGKGMDEPDAIAIFLVKGHAGSATVLSKDDGIEGLINKISLVHTIKSTLTGGLALPSLDAASRTAEGGQRICRTMT